MRGIPIIKPIVINLLNISMVFIKLILSIIILLSISGTTFSQEITQTLKGHVIDKNTQSPLGLVTVALPQYPTIGTTDAQGYYKLENIPIGRTSISFSYLGYKTIFLTHLEITSGKEHIINVELIEKVQQIKEVMIQGVTKTGVLNEAIVVSGRSFSIEESKKYAGTLNDVARMASGFAGVQSTNDFLNDIVIRGNSPNGILWRMDNMDIPNPNHFGDAGATGGPISMLNNNVLANSDFLTGAFPAEYPNALSGVFDLKTRNGNYDKHEFIGQVGFNGFELGAEGPLHKDSKSSYLLNYRYSILEILTKIGLDFGAGTAIPKYQDLFLKLNRRTKKHGTFSLIALGGINYIDFINSKKDTAQRMASAYASANMDIISQGNSGTIGVNHKYLWSKNTYSFFTLYLSGIKNMVKGDSIPLHTPYQTIDFFKRKSTNTKLAIHLFMKTRLNKKRHIKIGFSANNIYSYRKSQTMKNHQWNTTLDSKENAYILQPYINFTHKFNDNIKIITGINAQFSTLNAISTLEPKLGIKYDITPQQSLNLGYGIYSKLPSLDYYSVKVDGVYASIPIQI